MSDDEVIDCELITQIANEAVAVELAKPKSGTPEYRKWYRANKLTLEKKEEYKQRAREKEKALHALIRTVWIPTTQSGGVPAVNLP